MKDPQSHSPPDEPAAQSRRRKAFGFWQVFWIGALFVSLGYAWYCFYVPANDIAWAKDYASAQQQAAHSGKPLILYFTGKWCVPCKIMKRQVWADEQVTRAVNKAFVPLTLDVEDPGAVAALRRYRVGPTPTTIIADPQGKVLHQVEGGMSKADFLALLGKVN